LRASTTLGLCNSKENDQEEFFDEREFQGLSNGGIFIKLALGGTEIDLHS
jgi:hypothetical protein